MSTRRLLFSKKGKRKQNAEAPVPYGRLVRAEGTNNEGADGPMQRPSTSEEIGTAQWRAAEIAAIKARSLGRGAGAPPMMHIAAGADAAPADAAAAALASPLAPETPRATAPPVRLATERDPTSTASTSQASPSASAAAWDLLPPTPTATSTHQQAVLAEQCPEHDTHADGQSAPVATGAQPDNSARDSTAQEHDLIQLLSDDNNAEAPAEPYSSRALPTGFDGAWELPGNSVLQGASLHSSTAQAQGQVAGDSATPQVPELTPTTASASEPPSDASPPATAQVVGSSHAEMHARAGSSASPALLLDLAAPMRLPAPMAALQQPSAPMAPREQAPAAMALLIDLDDAGPPFQAPTTPSTWQTAPAAAQLPGPPAAHMPEPHLQQHSSSTDAAPMFASLASSSQALDQLPRTVRPWRPADAWQKDSSAPAEVPVGAAASVHAAASGHSSKPGWPATGAQTPAAAAAAAAVPAQGQMGPDTAATSDQRTLTRQGSGMPVLRPAAAAPSNAAASAAAGRPASRWAPVQPSGFVVAHSSRRSSISEPRVSEAPAAQSDSSSGGDGSGRESCGSRGYAADAGVGQVPEAIVSLRSAPTTAAAQEGSQEDQVPLLCSKGVVTKDKALSHNKAAHILRKLYSGQRSLTLLPRSLRASRLFS